MKRREFVGDICLYGNSRTGAGFIACRLDHGQTSGTGEPIPFCTFTEAVFAAVERLNLLGLTSGKVRIFAPGGDKMAVVELSHRIPCFGDLLWQPAPQYVLSAEELIKAAE